MSHSDSKLDNFVDTVWSYYRSNGRSFIWRENTEPYWVFVSEIMLQQTQTGRVAQKFPDFVKRFPSFCQIAAASLAEVLTFWQGLGYNRRGRFLREAASTIMERYQGKLPADLASLQELPGIGPNTAASILAFAYNIPSIFIETNIRTVFIHHFFPDGGVHDRDILPLVADTLDRSNPREWYWALMDYGVFVKKSQGNASKQSVHYAKQSRFTGSVRQARGLILKNLLAAQGKPVQSLVLRALVQEKNQTASLIDNGNQFDNPTYERALASLLEEGLIIRDNHPGDQYMVGQ